MKSSLTLKPLLKPGVTDLVLSSEGRLLVCTHGRWSAGSSEDFRDLFVVTLEEIEPRAVQRLEQGERAIVRMLATETRARLRSVIYECRNAAGERVIEIALRVHPWKLPTPRPNFPRQVVERLVDSDTGLYLIAGGLGQGKSTFAAMMLHEYVERCRKRCVVIGDPLEFVFAEYDLVSYQEKGPSASAIEEAGWMNFSFLLAEKVVEKEAKDRVTQLATSQICVSTIQSHDTVSALQLWLGDQAANAEFLADSLAGVITVSLREEAGVQKPYYDTLLLPEVGTESGFAMRGLVARRDWVRLRRRLQDETAAVTRRVA